MSLFIRNASIADLPAILEVEKSWPESGRASADKFIARIEKFAQGFFLVCKTLPNGEEKVVATVTSMPLWFDPNQVSQFTSWDKVTHHGMLDDCNLNHKNALYIISGVIDKAHRGENIFEPGVLRVALQAQNLGMRYVIAGAVIPGYRKYCQNHQEIPAWEYCQQRKGSKLVDPLLAMYEGIQFRIPHASHVVPEYYPDDASRNYAAIVVRDLSTDPLSETKFLRD